jgi:hypothetical protein
MRTVAPAAIAGWLVAAGSAPLTIGLRGTVSPELERGIVLGIEEAGRTATLLGRDVRLVRIAGTRPDRLDAVVAATALPADRGSKVPIVYVAGPTAPRVNRCTFFIRESAGRKQLVTEWSEAHGADKSAAGDLAIVDWDSSLRKYGASELNERYRARFGAPMPEDAWVGWVAVKAIVEAALRNGAGADACSALESVRFDGHEGAALSFDRETGGLADPVYVVRRTHRGTEVIGEVRPR